MIDFRRYQRQIMLPQIGEEGQEKLFSAKVLVVGVGGLGSPVLYYLAAAGVGTLGLVDGDAVEVTNLQRQVLHWEKDLLRPKVLSALEKLQAFNSSLNYDVYSCRFDLETGRQLIPRYDLVVAAVDNRESRRVINQVCFETNRPWVEGGVGQFTGVVTVFRPPGGPCYRCLYRDIPANEEDRPPGLLGTLAGVIGILQAQEALKLILNIGKPLVGRLLIYDSLEARFESVEIRPDPNCPICGGK
ncbi:MAG: HesA/MoeB/ThiF family protein [Peptococcaceae bacterium]|jgi:adenylyltransferase/sulfurtransferase|nr:HesA/MoeB/ThiF family protein [Peptococcaceae bacterium]MDH7524409.1 HesA/MoeB/ThiF family protein [Peptococcaceae bacterium]